MNREIIAHLGSIFVEQKDVNNIEWSAQSRRKRVAESVRIALDKYPVIQDREVMAALEEVWDINALQVESLNYSSWSRNSHLKNPDGFYRTALPDAINMLEEAKAEGDDLVVVKWMKGSKAYSDRSWSSRQNSLSFYHLENEPLKDYIREQLKVRQYKTTELSFDVSSWIK